MENNAVFCIPSYKRSNRQDTLKYLRSVGVPKAQIYLFVQTEDDFGLYSQYVDNCNLIYTAADSLPKARNNILNYFGGNENIVMMDDDISIISVRDNNGKLKCIENKKQFQFIIDRMFEYTNAIGALWGFYPVYNAFFMSDTLDKKKPVNTIIGFPNGFKERFDEEFIAKEDIELCGRILASGRNIVRCNNVAFKAKHRTNSGGANDIWKSGINKKYSELLEMLYPDIYAVQSNNPEEIRTITKGGRIKIHEWKV